MHPPRCRVREYHRKCPYVFRCAGIAQLPLVVQALERVDGFHAGGQRGHIQVEVEVIQLVAGFGYADKSRERGGAVAEAAGIGAGDIGALQGGHEAFDKRAAAVEVALLHAVEYRRGDQDIALNGVARAGAVRFFIEAGAACEGGAADIIDGVGIVQAHNAVLAAVAAEQSFGVVGIEPGEDLVGRQTFLHFQAGILLVDCIPVRLRVDDAQARQHIADDARAPAARKLRVVETTCARAAHLAGERVYGDDGEGVLGGEGLAEEAEQKKEVTHVYNDER